MKAFYRLSHFKGKKKKNFDILPNVIVLPCGYSVTLQTIVGPSLISIFLCSCIQLCVIFTIQWKESASYEHYNYLLGPKLTIQSAFINLRHLSSILIFSTSRVNTPITLSTLRRKMAVILSTIRIFVSFYRKCCYVMFLWYLIFALYFTDTLTCARRPAAVTRMPEHWAFDEQPIL